MPPPVSERSRTHSALASASRVRILKLLRGSDTPLDVAQIATRSGLHPNTVRFHLKVLVDAGLACCRTDPRGASGRPRIIFTATTDGVDSAHGFLLADILASYLAASSKIPAGLAEEAGHAFAKRHWRSIRPATPVPANEIIHRVVAMFTEFGFEPELTRRGQDLQIRLHACPFRTIASRYPEVVCAMHLGLLRGTLVELGASTTTARLRSFVEPHLCVAHITSTSQSASDAERLRAPSLEDQPDRAHP